MANNVFANTPAAVIAKQDISFVAAGITALNTNIIFRVGNPLQSYVPGRSINAIVEFEENQGYYMVPKLDMDLSAIIAPPLPTGGGGSTPSAPTAGVVNDTADTFNWTNNPLFPDLSDYETTVNGGGAWITAVAKPLVVGDVAKAIGQVGVRVKAVGGNPASAGLFNATAFTVAASMDSDAQAALTAAGVSDSTTQTAVNNLFLALKAIRGGAFYPTIDILYIAPGLTAAANKYNSKNPLDTDAAFRLVFSGGITHGAFGMRGGGSAGTPKGRTFFNPSINMSVDVGYQGVYLGGTAETGEFFPAGLLSSGNGSYIKPKGADGSMIASFNSTTGGGPVTSPLGYTSVTQRTGGLRTFKNGVPISPLFANTPTRVNLELFLFCLNNAGVSEAGPISSDIRTYIHAHSEVSDAEDAAINTAIHNYNTAMGRPF